VNNFSSKIAVAVAVAVMGASAQAGTVATVGASTHSVQFSAREGAISATSQSVAVSNFTYTPAVALNSGDVLTLTLSGASFGTSSTAAAGFGTATPGGGGTAIPAANSSGTTTTKTYTLDANVAAGTAITFAGHTLLNSSLGSTGSVTASVSVSRGTSTIDTAAAVAVATKVNEFAVTVQRVLNGVVDMIGATGKQWTSAAETAAAAATTANAATRDTLTLKIVDTDVTGAGDASLQTSDALRVTLGGDFNFLNNTSAAGVSDGVGFPLVDGGDKLEVLRADSGAAIGSVLSATASEIVLQFTAAEVATINALAAAGTGAANGDSTILVRFVSDNSDTANVKKAQTFTASANWYFTTTNSAVAQTYGNPALTAGSNTINGTTVFVPYLPVGSGISQVLQLVNNSSSAGTAKLSARNQAGVACSNASFGTVDVGANRVVDLGPALAAGIAACYGGASTTNKLFVTVEANVPDTGVEVYSAYNVSGNRVNVTNSSNGRKAADISCETASVVGTVAGGASTANVNVCSSITNGTANSVGGGNGARN